MEQKQSFIGIDVGGSHITAALIDPITLEIVANSKRRSAVNSSGMAKEILITWITTIKSIIQDFDTPNLKVGVAMPGPFDYETGICLIKGLAKYESLYGLNIKDIFSIQLRIDKENILFRNDAEAFLSGESHFLNQESKKIIGITLGTGLGSAIHDGISTRDVNRAQITFKGGIAEDFISTRWFQKEYYELTGLSLKDVKALATQSESDLKKDIFDKFSSNLAEFLNDFISEENPDILIIGGNIAKCWDYFYSSLKDKIFNKNIVIQQSVLWEDASLVGAAGLFIHK